MLPCAAKLPWVSPLLLAPEPPRVSSQLPAAKSALAIAVGISANAATKKNAFRNIVPPSMYLDGPAGGVHLVLARPTLAAHAGDQVARPAGSGISPLQGGGCPGP